MRSRGKQISRFVMRSAILNRSRTRLFNRPPFTAGFHKNGNAVYQELGYELIRRKLLDDVSRKFGHGG
jgi:hypothetical protein